MADSVRDIDWIVQEVLRRLTAAAGESGAPVSRKANAQGSAKGRPNRGELHVRDRVITLAGLNGRLDGIQAMVVPARAVITPAVRDVLNRKKIRLRFQTTTEAATQSVGLLVGTAVAGYDPAPLLRAISGEVSGVEEAGRAGLREVLDTMVAAVVEDDRIGLLLTNQPALANCVANRHAGVRAAWGWNAQAVRHGLKALGANLLVADPAAMGLHDLSAAVRQFVRGDHHCPAAWRNQLDAATMEETR